MQYSQKMVQILTILLKQKDQVLFQINTDSRKENAKGRPSLSKDIPNNGEVNSIAGIKPINALIKAVKTRETIISLIFIGAINRFVKFLLQISSRNNILKPILVLNKKS